MGLSSKSSAAPALPRTRQPFCFSILGPRREIITQDGAEFWFVYKAHPPANIGICVGGCNAVDGPKKQARCVIISRRGPYSAARLFASAEFNGWAFL